MVKKGKHRRYTQARELKQMGDDFDSNFADDLELEEATNLEAEETCPECSNPLNQGHKDWCLNQSPA